MHNIGEPHVPFRGTVLESGVCFLTFVSAARHLRLPSAGTVLTCTQALDGQLQEHETFC